MSRHDSRRLQPAVRISALALLAALVGAQPLRAAIIAPIFVENLDDATLVPQLTTNGAPAFSNGFADLDGNNTAGAAQGFYMNDISAFNSADGGAGPGGGGPTVSWIMEAIIGPDAVAGSDGLGAAPSSNDVLFSFNGRYGLRFATATNWSLFSRIAGGASDVNSGIPNAADRPSAGSHVAIVFTDNGTTDTLAYYKNGVLAHSIAGDFNRNNINRAGFGLEINSGAALARGFNGTFDAISFSTFSGTFDPSSGDLFALPVPEPLVWPVMLGAMALVKRRARAA